jgi:hypothetical protein
MRCVLSENPNLQSKAQQMSDMTCSPFPAGSPSNQAAVSPSTVRSVKEESWQINNMNRIPRLPVFSAPSSVSACNESRVNSVKASWVT